MNNWYVITGGPSCGKTTVLKELKNRGYKTVEEAARIYIDREIDKGKSIEDIRGDELFFQKELLIMKIETEKKLNQDDTIFFDRGIPDTIAYLEIKNFTIEDYIKSSVEKSNYKKVFLFDLLKYEKDYARTETVEEAKIIQQLLKQSYEALKIPVLKVPVMSLNERVQFILNNI
ncbi:MAG TPA: ATP-binding protein [Candidatus Nitrosocosmicus sp.]|nr:ATP-binding protein [Candidatus Nitrosocosmicus sp.]